MLQRVLEAELMDSPRDAFEYDAMDHAAVNAQFVTDLLAAIADHDCPARPTTILDLGAGTAQIPIELCRRVPDVHVVAIDAAESMVALARENVRAAGLQDRIEVIRADAKHLATNAVFPIVASNSILHHIAVPRDVIAQAVEVTMPEGLLFHRDLARPADEASLESLAVMYASGSNPYQAKLFADSLRAALTLEEMRALVAEFDFDPNTVQMTSDRHWTWVARKP